MVTVLGITLSRTEYLKQNYIIKSKGFFLDDVIANIDMWAKLFNYHKIA